MRVAVDTSTSFSALAFNGTPARVLESLQSSDEWELAISEQMCQELRRVLMEKSKDSPQVLRALNRYFSLAVMIVPTKRVRICRDSNDDFILECAIEAAADLIIASDGDLLDVSRHPEINGIEIINVQEAKRRFVTGAGNALT